MTRRSPHTSLASAPFVCLTLVVGGHAMVLRFYYMIVTSIKPGEETVITGIRLWVEGLTLDAYRDLLDPQGVPFLRSVLNSILIVGATVAGNLVLCPLAGYGFAKHHFPGVTRCSPCR